LQMRIFISFSLLCILSVCIIDILCAAFHYTHACCSIL
jgi:hypothetical protein